MEKYEKDAEEILKEFSKKLEGIPNVEELFYTTEQSNVLRSDNKAVKKDVYRSFLEIAPKKDSKGNVIVERMKL